MALKDKAPEENGAGYLHGFTEEEQLRLRTQARFSEYSVYENINLSGVKDLLEVGCGVGAQSEILLRRFPNLKLTGVDSNPKQLESAKKSLNSLGFAEGRWNLHLQDATAMDLPPQSFDGAFLCWVLEHMTDTLRVLSEIRRVLAPGGKIVINEVMNSSFFLDPYSPNVWQYWMAFNDYQNEIGGDPFIGMKLGNMLLSLGFKDISTHIKTWHLDNRHPEKRKEYIDFWTELLLSASEQLIKTKYVTKEIVQEASKELKAVSNDPNSVFHFSFMQAKAKVY